MKSNKPYLLRAMHEWLTDNGDVPHILVDGSIPALDAVRAHVEDGKITLNISYDATQELQISNEDVSFRARFAGQFTPLVIPVLAVLGVYGRDSGQGMMFPEDTEPNNDPSRDTDPDSGSDSDSNKDSSHLTLLK